MTYSLFLDFPIRKRIIRFLISFLYFVVLAPPKANANLSDELAGSNSKRQEFVVGIGEKRSYRLIIHRIVDQNSLRNGTTFLWITFPSQKVGFRVVEAHFTGNPKELYERSFSTSNLILISGGFWRRDERREQKLPLGLVLTNGSKVSPMVNWTEGGVLWGDADQNVFISRVANATILPSAVEALQSKPILVYGGLNDIRKDSYDHYNRIAVGLSFKGDLVVAALFGASGDGGGSLYEFAEIMSNGAYGGPKIDRMLALDGGPSAHLYFPTLKLHFGELFGDLYIPNLIQFCFDCE